METNYATEFHVLIKIGLNNISASAQIGQLKMT